MILYTVNSVFIKHAIEVCLWLCHNVKFWAFGKFWPLTLNCAYLKNEIYAKLNEGRPPSGRGTCALAGHTIKNFNLDFGPILRLVAIDFIQNNPQLCSMLRIIWFHPWFTVTAAPITLLIRLPSMGYLQEPMRWLLLHALWLKLGPQMVPGGTWPPQIPGEQMRVFNWGGQQIISTQSSERVMSSLSLVPSAHLSDS